MLQSEQATNPNEPNEPNYAFAMIPGRMFYSVGSRRHSNGKQKSKMKNSADECVL